MKKVIYLIFALIAAIIVSCNNPEKTGVENPIIGTWEEISYKYVSPDTAYERTQFESPRIKLYTKKHFALGYQSGENRIGGGGGDYTFDNESYTSTIKYHSNSAMVGVTRKYKSVLDGDLWTISIRNESTGAEVTEIWKRIPE
jgi:hypothetical protein